jgi:hypothetical protein
MTWESTGGILEVNGPREPAHVFTRSESLVRQSITDRVPETPEIMPWQFDFRCGHWRGLLANWNIGWHCMIGICMVFLERSFMLGRSC